MSRVGDGELDRGMVASDEVEYMNMMARHEIG